MFTIDLNTKSKESMYEQIYKYIRSEIKNGNLKCGTKLPSSRGLAKNLQVSRNTIDIAYAQLLSEGYIFSEPKKGYYVCEIENLMDMSVQDYELDKDFIEDEKKYRFDFTPYGVDMNYFPYDKWRKLLKEAISEYNSEIFQSGNEQGDKSLRLEISRYLHEFRGVNCKENQIIVGAGIEYLLLLLSQIIGKDKVIAIENPTYIRTYKIFNSLGYNIKPINLDKNGIKINELIESNADIVYVSPSHQFPMGNVMPIKRRNQLLSWARKEDRYIIEDDYDSEFRYLGKPIPALQGIDTAEKVIYLGTFSKAIAPSIRISYMVLPKKLLAIYKKNYSFYSCTVSRVDQFVLCNFIKKGYFERHLNKMRNIYKSKHDKLESCLKLLKNDINIYGKSAGLHFVLEFKNFNTEEEIYNKLIDNKIKIYPLSNYIIGENKFKNPIFLIGFAKMSEEDIELGIRAIKNVLNI